MSSFTNPLILQRADPWILKHTDGFYYFTASVPEYDRIILRRSFTVQGLSLAGEQVIWRKHATRPLAEYIWAPELHHLGDAWYIYVAGSRNSLWDIRMYVLRNPSPDPMVGTWEELGPIRTDWDSFALDATPFEHRGTRYLAWAQNDPKFGPGTPIYLAAMKDPISLASPQICITQPTLPWETIGHRVNEGPAILKRNGRIFLTYSASATDHNYCLGMLTIDENADLMNPENWKKSQEPVFKTNEKAGQYGPGHNSFTVSEDGKTDLLVYHARTYSGAYPDPLRDPNRHARVQPFTWKPDGSPDFGSPLADSK